MPSKAILLDACLSLLNSKLVEQRERGESILQAGDFSQPDNIKHLDALLACLKHPVAEANATIRRNLLSVMPTLFHRCGGSSLRASLDQLVPHLAERLVDGDAGVRDASRAALLELLAVVRPSDAVPALLARSVLGRGSRTREAVLLLLAELLANRHSPASAEFASTCGKKEQLCSLLRLVDEATSPTTLAVLAVVQQLYAHGLATPMRPLLTTAAQAAGLPRHALRLALARLDEFDRGAAPDPPLPPPPPPPPPPPLAATPTAASRAAELRASTGSLPPSLAATTPAARPPAPSRKSVSAETADFVGPPSPVKVRSADEALRELREIARELKKPPREADGVWQERAAAMRRLHGLLLGGAARMAHFSTHFHAHLVEPLAAQLKDLRSRCVRIACECIGEAARCLGPLFREAAIDLLPTLLRVVRATVTVIADAADGCVRELLRHVRSGALLLPILHGATARDATPQSRARCCQYMELMVRAEPFPLLPSDDVHLFETHMGAALSDASAEVRTAARAAYTAYEACFPAAAAALRDKLQLATPRLMMSSASPHKRRGEAAGSPPRAEAPPAAAAPPPPPRAKPPRAAGGGGSRPWRQRGKGGGGGKAAESDVEILIFAAPRVAAAAGEEAADAARPEAEGGAEAGATRRPARGGARRAWDGETELHGRPAWGEVAAAAPGLSPELGTTRRAGGGEGAGGEAEWGGEANPLNATHADMNGAYLNGSGAGCLSMAEWAGADDAPPVDRTHSAAGALSELLGDYDEIEASEDEDRSESYIDGYDEESVGEASSGGAACHGGGGGAEASDGRREAAEAELAEAYEAIQSLEERLAEREAQLRDGGRAASALEEKAALLEAMRRQRDVARREGEEARRERDAVVEELVELRDEKERLRLHAAQLAKQAELKDAQLEQLRREVEARAEEAEAHAVARAEALEAEVWERVNARSAELQAREEQLYAGERRLEERQARVAARERAAAEAEAEVAAARREMEAQQRHALATLEQKQTRQARHDKEAQLLARQERELQQAQAESARQRAELSKREADLRVKEAELRRAEQQLVVAHDELRKRDVATRAMQQAERTPGWKHAPPGAPEPAGRMAGPHSLADPASAVSRPRGSATPAPPTSGARNLPVSTSRGARQSYPVTPVLPTSPLMSEGDPSDVSELLAACNAYVDNIVHECLPQNDL